MRRGLILLAAAIAMASLAGCDDDSGTKPAKTEKHAAASATARLGVGWRAVAEARSSAWDFAAGPGPAADPIDGIRSAIESGTLPPKAGVQIASLIDRFATDLPAPEAGKPAFRPTVVLTATPWNEDTLLLWIGVAGGGASGALMPRDLARSPDHPAITVEFDAKTIAAYRPVGDPSPLPSDGGAGQAAAVLYEVSPLRDLTPGAQTRLAVLRIRYRLAGSTDPTVHEVERPITGADLVDTIDDAPETVRFAAAVAGFGGLLRGDPAVRDLSCDEAISLAKGATGADPDGARTRFVGLMLRAAPLIDQPPPDSAQAGDAAP